MSTCKAGEVYSAARTLWVLMEQITTAADHVSLQIDAFQGCKVVFSFRYVPFEAVCREVQAVCDLQSRAILVYAPTRTRVWRVSRELRRQLAKVMGGMIRRSPGWFWLYCCWVACSCFSCSPGFLQRTRTLVDTSSGQQMCDDGDRAHFLGKLTSEMFLEV